MVLYNPIMLFCLEKEKIFDLLLASQYELGLTFGVIRPNHVVLLGKRKYLTFCSLHSNEQGLTFGVKKPTWSNVQLQYITPPTALMRVVRCVDIMFKSIHPEAFVVVLPGVIDL